MLNEDVRRVEYGQVLRGDYSREEIVLNIASCSLPSRRDCAELKHRTLEDGLDEAAVTERKYYAMI